MPAILSKLWDTVVMPEWVFHYNCYEIGHTWSCHCTEAATEMGLICFREGLKMYAGLYLLSHLIFSRRLAISYTMVEQLVTSSLRSATFLGFNAWAIFTIFCALRHVSGGFYYSVFAVVPAFFGSLAAITIERPARRAALAVYVANIASECLYKIGRQRGVYTDIPHGSVLLFTVSSGVLMYLVRVNGYGQDPISMALRFLLGTYESKQRAPKKIKEEQEPSNLILAVEDNEEDQTSPTNKNLVTSSVHLPSSSRDRGQKVAVTRIQGSSVPTTNCSQISSLIGSLRHRLCAHSSGCAAYALAGFLRPFAYGAIGQTVLTSLLTYRQVLKMPTLILTNGLLSRRSLYLGLFLGGFSSVFKAANCVQRHLFNVSSDWQALVAGLLAGPTMFFAPSSTLAQYVLWKAIEMAYCSGVQLGYCPYSELTIGVVYAASVSVMFYTVIMEPGQLRGSYMKFLDRITEHRLHRLNRNLLDIFGTGASAGYEDFFPDLHPDLCTRKFLETILVWVI